MLCKACFLQSFFLFLIGLLVFGEINVLSLGVRD